MRCFNLSWTRAAVNWSPGQVAAAHPRSRALWQQRGHELTDVQAHLCERHQYVSSRGFL